MNGTNDSMMVLCMAAILLFTLAILVTLIIQAVLQAKILGELKEKEVNLKRENRNRSSSGVLGEPT